MKKIKIKTKKPWIAYPGPPIQQGYAESQERGYLLWDIKSAKNFDVEFRNLQNYQPFITIDWEGSVEKFSKKILKFPKGSRVRVKSSVAISQREMNEINDFLKAIEPIETTFKIDDQVNRDIVTTGDLTVLKQDLRSLDTQMKLFKSLYKNENLTSEQWSQIESLVKKYLDQASSDERQSNIKWSLKRLEFDNTFTYGKDNAINFENLNGITGVFGPNRIGKSSIVGTLLYTLFNTTDRGVVKNIHVINARKNYCNSRATLTVDGTDYYLERQTVKHENKKSEILATTSLNLFKIGQDGVPIDMNGDQRNDTDKTLRKLIGDSEDYTLSGLSTQGDLLKFVNEGSTARKLILSRFLDLNIFEKMHSLANDDLIVLKAAIKNTKDLNWDDKIKTLSASHDKNKHELVVCEDAIHTKRLELDELKSEINNKSGKRIITQDDLDKQTRVVNSLSQKITSLRKSVADMINTVSSQKEKISKIENIKNSLSIEDLRKKLSSQNDLEKNLQVVKHEYDVEMAKLTQQEKSLNKLQQVPCGDNFPSCMYIKDSYQDKLKIADQKIKVSSMLKAYEKLMLSFENIKDNDLTAKIKQYEQMNDMYTKLAIEMSKNESEIKQATSNIDDLVEKFANEESKLALLQSSFNSDESEVFINLRNSIEKRQSEISNLEMQKVKIASELGKIDNQISNLKEEKLKYEDVLTKHKVLNAVTTALSKRGIPNHILYSQLPIINSEISKILSGIIDFNIELQSDVDSNSMDIYINYGDSKRIIELGSGMEKTIASIAIRAALIQITSLPKTDLFVIDEGFGTLDAAQIEVCNRFLISLKKMFKNIMIISHVEAMKDIVDNVIEINRFEKDSKVMVN